MANLERLVSMEDLRRRARRRMPRVAWEFLDSGTGAETALKRNRERMDAVTMVPRMMRAARTPDTSAPLLGRTWTAPIGVAPVGVGGLASARGGPGSAFVERRRTGGNQSGSGGWNNPSPQRRPTLRFSPLS